MVTVSVIITTKNEAQHLTACLESVKSQSYKNIEIIIVDNHSSDNTKEIAKKYTSFVYTAGPERSAQRNFGAKKAKGTHLLFIDADMILEKNVLKDCADQSKTYRALVIPEKSFGIGFWAHCKTLERACYEGVGWMEAARFYQKKTFKELGGYNEQLTGPEDFELSQRMRTRFGVGTIGRVKSYILHDEGELKLWELLKRKFYYGRQMRRYSRLPESRTYFNKQSNIFMRYALYFRNPAIVLSDPLGAAGMVFMKTLEMLVLALGGLGL